MNPPSDSARDVFDTESEDPVDRAATALDGRGQALASAFLRAIPFLFRDGVPLAPLRATAEVRAAVEDALTSPRHVLPLRIEPDGASASLLLDAAAVAFLLDGALGGDGSSPPTLAPDGITGPQRALLGRVLAGVVPAFSSVMEAALGLRFKKREAGDDGSREEPVIALRFRLGEGGAGGTIVLALAKAALLGASSPGRKAGAFDPAVAAALAEAPLLLVAELGRIRLTLGEVAELQVGDVLELPTTVGSAVPVRVEGHVLFRAHPITSGSHVAVRIASSDDNGVTVKTAA
jgi:hypothetical protein